MATPIGISMNEEQLTNRRPLFNDRNYTYWNARMRIFIQEQDYDK